MPHRFCSASSTNQYSVSQFYTDQLGSLWPRDWCRILAAISLPRIQLAWGPAAPAMNGTDVQVPCFGPTENLCKYANQTRQDEQFKQLFCAVGLVRSRRRLREFHLVMLLSVAISIMKMLKIKGAAAGPDNKTVNKTPFPLKAHCPAHTHQISQLTLAELLSYSRQVRAKPQYRYVMTV